MGTLANLRQSGVRKPDFSIKMGANGKPVIICATEEGYNHMIDFRRKQQIGKKVRVDGGNFEIIAKIIGYNKHRVNHFRGIILAGAEGCSKLHQGETFLFREDIIIGLENEVD